MGSQFPRAWLATLRNFLFLIIVLAVFGAGNTPSAHGEEKKPSPCNEDAMIVFDASGSMSGNQVLGIPNSRVMAEYAISLGIPRANVIEEDRSRTTYENLLYSMQIIKAQNLGQPTLVTLDLYTRRAVATARKMGWKDFHWLSVFSRGEPAYGYKWLQTHSRTTIFCYEVGALILSKIVGWA